MLETVFGQCGEGHDSLVDHVLKTMRQMIAVAPMDDDAFDAPSVELQSAGQVQWSSPELAFREKLVLHSEAFSRSPF